MWRVGWCIITFVISLQRITLWVVAVILFLTWTIQDLPRVPAMAHLVNVQKWQKQCQARNDQMLVQAEEITACMVFLENQDVFQYFN